MNFLKSKIKKGVWYQEELWKVRDFISPNKHQVFLILERETGDGYDDGTDALELEMIDVNNSNFFPNTPEVSEIMKRRKKESEVMYEEVCRGALSKAYLGMFKCDHITDATNALQNSTDEDDK